MRSGEQIYLMLAGGDKSTQAKDIQRAVEMAKDLKTAERRKQQVRKPK